MKLTETKVEAEPSWEASQRRFKKKKLLEKPLKRGQNTDKFQDGFKHTGAINFNKIISLYAVVIEGSKKHSRNSVCHLHPFVI